MRYSVHGWLQVVVVAAVYIVLGYVHIGAPSQRQESGKGNGRHFIVDREKIMPYATTTQIVGPYTATFQHYTGGFRWAQQITAPSTRTPISIHVQVIQPASHGSWHLKFQALGDCTKTCDDDISSESPRAEQPDMWSYPISSNAVLVQFSSVNDPEDMHLTIDMYDYPVVPTIGQSIVGQPNFGPIGAYVPSIRALGSAVARLRIKTRRGEIWCTGFLISDSLLLTNYHCIMTKSEAANARAEFGADAEDSSPTVLPVVRLEAVNSNLAFDYAVVRVSGTPGSRFGHIRIPRVGDPELPTSSPRIGSLLFAGTSQPLLVIEHPGGGPKKVSDDDDCAVISPKVQGIDAGSISDFSHGCDTLGGSSGSPVFLRSSGQLVGLHHLGFEDNPGAASQLKNQAVYIGYVIADLISRYPAVYSEISRNGNAGAFNSLDGHVVSALRRGQCLPAARMRTLQQEDMGRCQTNTAVN